jgi:hypothetical protein
MRPRTRGSHTFPALYHHIDHHALTTFHRQSARARPTIVTELSSASSSHCDAFQLAACIGEPQFLQTKSIHEVMHALRRHKARSNSTGPPATAAPPPHTPIHLASARIRRATKRLPSRVLRSFTRVVVKRTRCVLVLLFDLSLLSASLSSILWESS